MAKRLCLCKLNDPPLGHNSFVSPVRDKHKGYTMGGKVILFFLVFTYHIYLNHPFCDNLGHIFVF